ncbi:unnamed protein product [Closterium sp. Naga37s-1]|nr:unnamed protein product [Closterium sp. Naga37s-1]
MGFEDESTDRGGGDKRGGERGGGERGGGEREGGERGGGERGGGERGGGERGVDGDEEEAEEEEEEEGPLRGDFGKLVPASQGDCFPAERARRNPCGDYAVVPGFQSHDSGLAATWLQQEAVTS